MIRVLVVDDHVIFREGIKRVIGATSDIEVVGEAGDGRAALRLALEAPCDVMLLDLALPGIDGLDVLRAVKTQRPALAVLILSIYAEDQYAVRVLKERASGYLAKESVPDELIRAIRKAARGEKYVSDSLAVALAEDRAGIAVPRAHEALSSREYQIFRLLAAGTSIKEIARELALARTTVASYRARVLEKLRMKTNSDLIRYALEQRLIS